MTIRVLPEADDEVRAAAERYEGARTDLGERFLDDLAKAYDRIARDPGIHPAYDAGQVKRGYQYVMLKRFPFSVIDLVQGAEIVVLAVANHRRKPGSWKTRQV